MFSTLEVTRCVDSTFIHLLKVICCLAEYLIAGNCYCLTIIMYTSSKVGQLLQSDAKQVHDFHGIGLQLVCQTMAASSRKVFRLMIL